MLVRTRHLNVGERLHGTTWGRRCLVMFALVISRQHIRRVERVLAAATRNRQ